MDELTEKQDKHSTRPDVFDDVEEEHAIDILTAEITQVAIYSSGMWSVVQHTTFTCTCGACTCTCMQ